MSTQAVHSDEKCIFCMIIAGKIPSYKVLETEHVLAFLDINPVSEGHTQIIPKYHAKTIGELPDDYLREIGPTLKKVALATGVEQYNILQNNGKLAFQHVDHVHFHVIPKPNEKEGLIFDMANLEKNWPMRKAEKEELVQTLNKMQAKM